MLILIILYLNLSVLTSGQNELSTLRKRLLTDYDPQVRPVLDNTNTTIVNVMIMPLYIVDLDEHNHVFTLDAWIALRWKDKRFNWDDKIYSDNINFHEYEIWKPGISVSYITDSSPKSSVDVYSNTIISVQRTGDVYWTPPATFNTHCVANYTNYPDDQQTCWTNITAWYTSGDYVDLYVITEKVDVSFLDNNNPIWEFIDSKCIRKKQSFDMEYDVGMKCAYILKRRAPHGRDVEWALSLVAAVLTLSMFWMPPEKGKKLMLGCTSLLILFGEILYFTFTSPSLGIAMFSAHLIQQSIFTVLSALVLEIIVLNLTRISGFSPPNILTDFLAGPVKIFFCLCPPDERKTPLQKDWYIVALSLDRILFLLYIIVFVALKKWV